MLRFIFITLLILLGGTLLGQFILKDSGYILLTYGGIALETSVWVGLIILFLGILLFALCYRLVFGFIRLPHHWDSWWRERTRLRTERGHIAALFQLASGNVLHASAILEKSPRDLLNLLLAYEAALMAENYAEAESLVDAIRKLGKGRIKEKKLFDVMMARVDAARGNYARAFTTLNAYVRHSKRDLYIYRLFCEVCVKGERWDALGDFLSALKVPLGKDLMLHYYRLYFESAHHLTQPEKIWNALKPDLRKMLLTIYTRKLIRTGGDDLAEEIVRVELQKDLNEELLRLYQEIRSSRIVKQLHFLENLAKEHPRHRGRKTLLLALAELCLHNKMWARANNYYEKLMEKHDISLEEVLPGLKRVLKKGTKNDKDFAQALISKRLATYSE